MARKLALTVATASLLATAGHVLAQQTGPNGGGKDSHGDQFNARYVIK